MSEALSYDGVDGVDKDEAERLRILDALGMELGHDRADAINGRTLSGIEKDWTEDEEHYEGVDDANRGEMQAWRTKPMGQTALNTDRTTSSTVFFNITRPYCDAASARVGDMLLPTDDRGWAIKPTPIPDMVQISQGKIPRKLNAQIDGSFPETEEGKGRAQKVKNELEESIKADIAEAKDKAEKAQRRIEDWHAESQYHAEMRQVIEDTAKMGTGILKGPVPVRKNVVAYVDGEIVIQEDISPMSVRVDCWNMFPDPGCGNNIHDGGFIFERDDITRKKLHSLKGGNGYIDAQIDQVLKEGPHRATKQFKEGEGRRHELIGLIERNTKSLFEIWYYHGEITKAQLEACGCDVDDDTPEFVAASLTMVNNRVIRARMNLLDTGEFPYDFMVWQRRVGMPWGIGVARQIRTPQRVVNGAARNMMDNAGMAGGPMWAFHQGIIEPIDGQYELAPRKGWMSAEDADLDHLDNAFQFIKMDIMQEELTQIIELGLKMAEDVTGLPMLLQGQQGKAPETVGGMTMLNNNASTVMRRVARLFDDLITEPHVRRYYTYLLQFGEDEEKGDFKIDARGSSALVERDLNAQAIVQMGEQAINPVFGIDPKKWMEENLKAQRLDINRFKYDDEEWEQVVQQLLQPPPDSRVEVATINAQAKLQDGQAEREFKIALETIKEQHDGQDREMAVALEALAREMDTMKIAAGSEEAREKIKASLAEVVLKLQTQIDLAKNPEGAPQVATPIAEPPGRAPEGQAFQR
jgi:hypothetical protein